MITRLSATLFPLLLVLVWTATVPAQLIPELVQKGKRATALVEIRADDGIAFGSAFCIDKSGLFVTNAHVVEDAATDGVVKLVLHIGEKEQRVARARVVRSSDELDLALLKIDADLGLTPLELGKDDELTETMAVTSFGYPFGKALAVARDGYPNVSVNSSRITSLRKDGGKLIVVQVDGLLNPGNSGGPVLDPSGKVIGVVAAGVLGAGINFAIPVGRLAEYLASPVIRLDPTAIAYANRSRPADWTVEVTPATPGGRLPADLAVSVTIEGGSAAPRKVIARGAGDGKFKATVVPVPRDPERRVTVLVIIGGQILQGTILDRDLKVSGKTIALGDLRNLFSGPPPRVTTADGRTAIGPIGGLGKARVRLATGREIAIDLEQATTINVQSAGEAPTLEAVVVAVEVKQGTKVLGSLRRRLEFQGAAAAAAAQRTQRRVAVPAFQAVPAGTQAEGLLEIGGVLDDRTGGLGAGKSVRPPEVAIGAARVGPADVPAPANGVRIVDCPGAHIYSAAFSPDGQLCAFGGDDRVIRVLDVKSGREVHRLVQGSWVQGLTFSRDGKRLLAGSASQRTNTWDPTTGAVSHPLQDEHLGDINWAKLLPDGRRVLTVHGDRDVRIWDLASGTLLREVTSPGPSRIAVTPDAKRLLLASCRFHNVNAVPERALGQSLRLVDIEDGRELWSVTYPDGPRIIQLNVSQNGERCVAFLSDGTVCSYNVSDGKEVLRLKLAVAPRADTAALAPDGRRVVTGHDDRSVRLWDLASGAELAQIGLPVIPSGVPAFSPDGAHVAIGSFRGFSCLWTPAKPGNNDAPAAPDAPLERKLPASITDLCVGGAGRYLLLTLRDISKLAVFDVNAAAMTRLISLPSRNVLVAAGAEKFILVFPEEKLIHRWDLATLTREVIKPSPINGRIKAIAMGSDSDGPILAHWSVEGTNSFSSEWLSFLDLESLKVLKVRTFLAGLFQNNQRQSSSGAALSLPHFTLSNMDCQIRNSADGRLFGLWRTSTSPAGFMTMALDGKTVEAYYDHTDYGPLVPGPDGRLIFTGLGGVRDPGGKPILRVPEGSGPKPMYLPSADPLYFLGIEGLPGYNPQQPKSGLIRVAVHLAGNDKPLVTLGGLGEMDELAHAADGSRRKDLPIDRRFHWVPSANLLITIPPSNDRLVLRRLDIAKVLDQQDGDYLLVTSRAALAAEAGQVFRHQIAVKSRKGSVTYILTSGPDGMAVSPDGQVTWKVAPKDAGEEVIAILTLGDASGQEIFHTLRIRVR